MVRKAETFPPVTMAHIRGHGCRDLLVYCSSGRCHHLGRKGRADVRERRRIENPDAEIKVDQNLTGRCRSGSSKLRARPDGVGGTPNLGRR